MATGLVGFATPAAAQLVQNGGFESVGSNTQSYQVSASNPLPDWTLGNSSGINCVIYNKPSTTLCGSGYSSPYQSSNVTLAISPGLSPEGGNFLGADANTSYEQSISQTITGLVIGKPYTLTFYQAAGQQLGYSGATTDQWQVTFGTTQDSTTMSVASQGDVPWEEQTMTFTPTATSQVLTFLAIGTPANSEPPFALLDGIALNEVPEPASIALLGFGILGVAALRRRRAGQPA